MQANNDDVIIKIFVIIDFREVNNSCCAIDGAVCELIHVVRSVLSQLSNKQFPTTSLWYVRTYIGFAVVNYSLRKYVWD